MNLTAWIGGRPPGLPAASVPDTTLHVRVSALALVLLLAAAHPGAAAEGEQAITLSASYATFSIVLDDASPSATGGQLAVEYQRGVSDTLWFRAAADGGAYAADGFTWSAGATVGFTYAFDVLRYIPYLDFGAGVMFVGGSVDGGVRPYLELGAGIEILESPTFSWGLAAHFNSFASEIAYFTVGPRMSWRWGYF
jgi:hypothetical protein